MNFVDVAKKELERVLAEYIPLANRIKKLAIQKEALEELLNKIEGTQVFTDPILNIKPEAIHQEFKENVSVDTENNTVTTVLPPAKEPRKVTPKGVLPQAIGAIMSDGQPHTCIELAQALKAKGLYADMDHPRAQKAIDAWFYGHMEDEGYIRTAPRTYKKTTGATIGEVARVTVKEEKPLTLEERGLVPTLQRYMADKRGYNLNDLINHLVSIRFYPNEKKAKMCLEAFFAFNEQAAFLFQKLGPATYALRR